jgi:bifunctional non-homologous end joining protein LigD
MQTGVPQLQGAAIRFSDAKALAKLPVQNAILDGEIVCLDESGVSQFNQLFARKGEPVLYAFDLLWLDGEDLRQRPLFERKQRLERLIERACCERLLYAQREIH